MICQPCKDNVECGPICTNPTTCGCQHKKTLKMKDGTVAPLDSPAAQSALTEEKGKTLG